MISSIEWMAWNVMLAVIPVVLAYALVGVSKLKITKGLKYTAMAALTPIWFFFLPNTCYLITEWRHYFFTLDANNLFLRTHTDSRLLMPLLAFSIFYALYSGFGMMTFTLAVRPIERLSARVSWPIWKWGLPFFALVSLGVYLGLALRFNSWDMFYRSGHVWSAIMDVLTRPRLLAFIVGFGLFLWIAYEALDIWVDAIAERWKALTGKLTNEQLPN
ncbi:MAG: DUF1361 domain-containing protein [Armatimonadetes bacterium]|nr:DUF1361 domain-containing protein [Armatimonadota bacterium]